MKNILLTGSGGFIGSHLKKYLAEKFNLLTPRSYELNLLEEKEIENYFKNNKIDYIIHSASCGVRISPEATIEDVAKPNLKMFENLAKYANSKCPMITFGSGAEYDKSRPLCKISEDEFGKSVPKDPYGYSKYAISKLIKKRDNILNLRVFGIYGNNENSSRVTTSIINDYINQCPITINQNVIFDFIYIDDFCKIVEHFINNKTQEKFINVTPTESIDIVSLAKIVNNFPDYKSEIIIKQDGLNKEYTGNNFLLMQHIPDFKFTSYKAGMEELYDFIKSYNNNYN